MYISIFSDEFYRDIYEVLPIIKSWGMTHVDFRAMINGKPIEKRPDEELYALKAALDQYGLKAGVIQSSLCKVHLPDKARQAQEMEKLSEYSYSENFEPIIKARYEETIPEFVEKIGGTITQTSALALIRKIIDDDAIAVAAAGSLPGCMQRMWTTDAPNSYNMDYGYSCMGYEIAGARALYT